MAYPSTLDALTDPAGSQQMNDPALLHSVVEKAQNDSIEAIQAELGLLPKGGSASVRARLDAMDALIAGKAASSLLGAASGVATLDSGSKLVQTVDASKVTSGVFDAARIPSLDVAKITTGVFALARLPLLPASQTTSGTFDAARIPNLDAAKITTGTVDAARLPSSVTANANAKVVADIVARDAIPLIDRADGMFVLVRSPLVLWQWRADNSTWNWVGGAGMSTQQISDQTDYLALTTTTFAAGTNLAVVFIAPPSGKVIVTVGGHLENNTASAFAYLSWEGRTGGTVGFGTVIHTAVTDEGIVCGTAGGVIRALGANETLWSGLTPGDTYHVRAMHLTTTGNFDIFSRSLMVRESR